MRKDNRKGTNYKGKNVKIRYSLTINQLKMLTLRHQYAYFS